MFAKLKSLLVRARLRLGSFLVRLGERIDPDEAHRVAVSARINTRSALEATIIRADGTREPKGVVAFSSSVPGENEEFERARRAGVPVPYDRLFKAQKG